MKLRHTALWAAILFAFWIVLSGRLDALHLGMGVLSAGFVAWATQPLLALPPVLGGAGPAPVVSLRFPLYLAWLAGQIVVASLQVAYVVLHPRLPVRPRVVRLATPLPHNLARLTLANSITLTPGTVTLDVEGDEYVVHALTAASARSVSAEGEMPRRVRALFGVGGPAGGSGR
jgi:multicomponent Na+:H+ antiporter subunit E